MNIGKVLCGLLGHPPIVEHCFGYHYCVRCEEMVGDSLAGVYAAKGVRIVGHDCDECRSVKIRLRDRIGTPRRALRMPEKKDEVHA